jgi:hypothetical protein
VRFYAQAFLLRGVALLGITAVVWLLCTLLFATGSFVGTMCAVALCYLTVGGVTLLLSTMTRHAWLATLLLGAAAGITSGLTHSRWGWRPLFLLLQGILPPLHLAGSLISGLVARGPVPRLALLVAWFAGYGVLAIAAALAVIRRREWPL